MIFTARDVHVRLTTVGECIRHLRDGGFLLVFASGGIDPDPAIMSGAAEELNTWSPNLELFLRRIPQSQFLINITSGVL